MKKFINENKYFLIIFFVLISILVFKTLGAKLNNESVEEGIALTNNNPKIFIDIFGSVFNPGVYEVTDNNLIIDVIEMAGGLTDNADIDYVEKELILSKKVYPEMKIYIPVKNIDVEFKNNINNAGKEELIDIKGVGEVTADKIINSRPFYSWDEFKDKTKIRDDVINEIKLKFII